MFGSIDTSSAYWKQLCWFSTLNQQQKHSVRASGTANQALRGVPAFKLPASSPRKAWFSEERDQALWNYIWWEDIQGDIWMKQAETHSIRCLFDSKLHPCCSVYGTCCIVVAMTHSICTDAEFLFPAKVLLQLVIWFNTRSTDRNCISLNT